jgi:hypothetical protein
MEMDSYKSQILDGVLMGSGAKTKLYEPGQCLNFLVLNVHILAYLGSRGKPFFQNFEVFLVCLPIVNQYKFEYTNLFYTN